MKAKITISFVLWFTVHLLNISTYAQDHIVLNSFNVNIRTGPGTDFFVVCTAGKGEIFQLVDEKGDWVEIKMYSEDNRFVHRDLVYFLKEFVPGHNMNLPESEEEIKKINNDIEWATSIAQIEAEEIIPKAISKKKFKNFRNICMDKNIHNIFEINGIQSALYSQFMNH
ncbi:MAG: SH3 domain-containing protein [Bacteroidales bacterium]|nr:SH3 domain-containing protein [Bacteroidales bacterium]